MKVKQRSICWATQWEIKNKQADTLLKGTGVWDYISHIPEKLLKTRMMHGFLGKPNRTALKIEKKRWVFLISSRPLNQDAYLENQEELDEDEMPPIINFDTIYYYKPEYNEGEATLAGEVKTIDIDSVVIDHNKHGEFHSLTIDASSKKYQFVSKKRFIIEQWVDAIELSSRTAKEKQYSITGKTKNISMIITKYEIDRDQLREEIEKDIDFILWTGDMKNYREFEDIYQTLELLNDVTEDMVSTFDACLVQKLPRKDIIELYMDVVHTKTCERLTHEWNSKAFLMTPLDIYALLEWLHQYLTSLKRFGINDDSLENGYHTLVNAYKRKIHMQIYPMITNVLIRERDGNIEESESGELYTHSPADIFKIFMEVFDVISKQPMKELVLGVLEILHEVFSQYQRALYQMITMDTSLTMDYLIAINNNFSRFFDFIEGLLSLLESNDSVNEEEVTNSFDQRTVQQYFAKITAKIVDRVANETWLSVQKFYSASYLDLEIEDTLNKSFQIFEEKINLMNKQTTREVWKSYLNKSISAYIQVLFNSFSKIKSQKSEHAINKIQEDYVKIQEIFSEYMSKRLLRAGLEVLGDIKNFFESSIDFLPISVGKMRKDHGPAFNMNTIKALLSLRSDLSKENKTQVLNDSKDVLDQYKDDNMSNRSGIFSNVDTASAAKEFNEEMKDPEEETKGK
jgi:hypothetical protein